MVSERSLRSIFRLKLAEEIVSFRAFEDSKYMKFSVCIKQVPDVASTTRLENGRIVQDTERMVLNAYDASALEEAIVLAESHGDIEIDVVLVGPEIGAETVRKALAMGAAQGTHITVDATAEFDSRAYATVLAAYFRDSIPDLILCGKQSQDTDSGLTGGMLAAMLELPYTTNAIGLELEDNEIVVTRQGDVGQEIVALPFPSLVTCSNDMNDPRIPSLKGIMQSKKKPVTQMSVSDLGIEDDLTDSRRKALQILEHKNPPPREQGEMFEGDPSEVVARLMAEL